MTKPRRPEATSVGHLNARPGTPPTLSGVAGTHNLQLWSNRRGLLHVSRAAQESGNAALTVMLHGAGGNASHGLDLLRPYGDDANLIVLTPES